jgi:hypothetical protein
MRLLILNHTLQLPPTISTPSLLINMLCEKLLYILSPVAAFVAIILYAVALETPNLNAGLGHVGVLTIHPSSATDGPTVWMGLFSENSPASPITRF